MLRDYISINRLIRTILDKCNRAYVDEVYRKWESEKDFDLMRDVVLDDLKEIRRLWPKSLDATFINAAIDKMKDIEGEWIPPVLEELFSTLIRIMEQLEEYFSQQQETDFSRDIVNLLHPIL